MSRIVIKYGGSFMNDPNPVVQAHIATDLAILNAIGMQVAAVHGGGKAISQAMEQAGIKANFKHGLRVTDAQTIKIVDQTLNHKVNPEICELITENGGKPVCIKGNHITQCEKLCTDAKGNPIDIGFVGKVTEVNRIPIETCFQNGQLPVISPLATDSTGATYNVNADTAAGAVASALQADRLIYLSDVPGLLADPKDHGSLIPLLHAKEVPKLIASGVISAGMIPKIESAIHALKNGVKRVQLMDGRILHCLMRELFGKPLKCTEIVL